jgi:outer membrane protein
MRRCLLLIGLTLAMAPVALAEPAAAGAPARLPALPSPLRLTPDSAAAMAVARSTDVALNEQQINAARGTLQTAKAMLGVRVTGSAVYTVSGPPQSITLPGGGGSFQISPDQSHTETLQATVPLYLGGRAAYAKQAARAGIEAAEHNVAASQVQVAQAARQAVYGLLRLQQLVVVAQQRVTSVAEHLRIAQAMFEAGTVARFEVVQAETQLSAAKGDLIHARTGVDQQASALLQQLNVAQGTEVVVEEGVPPQLPPGNLQQLITTALAGRSEVDAVEAGVRAREASLRLARATDRPSVGLQGQVVNASESAFGGGTSWNLSLALTVPIYQGGDREAAVTQAKAGLETARLNVEQVEQRIALQVSQARLSVQDAQEALTVAEQGEVEARERVRIAQVRFSNGVSLGVEVLDAQTALAAAETQVVNSRYNLQVATAALRAALGLADLPKESS